MTSNVKSLEYLLLVALHNHPRRCRKSLLHTYSVYLPIAYDYNYRDRHLRTNIIGETYGVGINTLNFEKKNPRHV